MVWQVSAAANAVIAVAYFLITLAIVVPLARSNQLRSNPLGAATAAIFFTCAVHHGSHAVHMVLPSFGVEDARGLAFRQAWDWPLATWDVIGAVVAAYYWSLRRNYSSLMQGPSSSTTCASASSRRSSSTTACCRGSWWPRWPSTSTSRTAPRPPSPPRSTRRAGSSPTCSAASTTR